MAAMIDSFVERNEGRKVIVRVFDGNNRKAVTSSVMLVVAAVGYFLYDED
jgi:hypothetical protein